MRAGHGIPLRVPLYPFRLAAQISSYREGTLTVEAVRSCLDAGLDAVVICEAAAGPDRLPDAPATMIDPLDLEDDRVHWLEPKPFANDADKRSHMLQWTKQRFHDRPLWIVLLDGDEILLNGRYLRDLIQHLLWRDESRGARLDNPANSPTAGFPIAIMEADGSLSLTKSRVFNAGLIRRFVVSNLIVETVAGGEARLGHVPLRPVPTVNALARMIAGDDPLPRRYLDDTTTVNPESLALDAHLEHQFALPPLPCEPLIYHRTHLRHPARQTLRLHEQERDEILRLGYPTGDEPA